MIPDQGSVSGASITAAFIARYGREPQIFRAPARVNLIGEYTDFNGGLVLPLASSLYTWLAIAPRSDQDLRVYSANMDQGATLHLDQNEAGRGGQWLEYIKAAVHTLQQEGCAIYGADILIEGEIPLGGGLSSSASLLTVLMFALLRIADTRIPAARLALLCQRAESDYVGVRCGIMDQFTIAHARRGHALLLDCRSLRFEMVAMPRAARLLVVHSGVHHQLNDGSYNTRRQECADALACLQQHRPELGALCEVEASGLEHAHQALGDTLYRRCRHVISENLRVSAARRAMLDEDMQALGRIISASHASLRDDFEVSCPELDTLVEQLMDCAGVMGARMVGAGFGGCVLVLIEAAQLEQARSQIETSTGRPGAKPLWQHLVEPCDGVEQIGADTAANPHQGACT